MFASQYSKFYLEGERIAWVCSLTLLNSLLTSLPSSSPPSPGTKTQFQKLFNEIARVAERCLYEASKYGEVSYTHCIVVV
jgi:hypothetical protein